MKHLKIKSQKKNKKIKAIRGGSIIVLSKSIEKANKFMTKKQDKMEIYREICEKMKTLGSLSKDLVNPSKEHKNIPVDNILNWVITVISDDASQREYYYKVITDMFSKNPGLPKDVQDMDKKSVISGVISEWIILHKNSCAKLEK